MTSTGKGNAQDIGRNIDVTQTEVLSFLDIRVESEEEKLATTATATATEKQQKSAEILPFTDETLTM